MILNRVPKAFGTQVGFGNAAKTAFRRKTEAILELIPSRIDPDATQNPGEECGGQPMVGNLIKNGDYGRL